MMNSDSRLPSVREAFNLILTTFAVYLMFVFLSGKSDSKLQLLLFETGILTPAFIYVFLKKYDFRTVFRLHRVPLRLCFLGIIIGAGLNVLTDALQSIIQRIIPIQQEVLDALNSAMVFNSVPDFIYLFIGGVFVAGLGEEMLFRGLLQGVLEHSMDVTKGVVYSALVFTFLHFNPWWAIEILILGVLTGVLTWRSGSIFPAVALHMAINGLSLILLNSEAEKLTWYFNGSSIQPVFLAGAFFAVIGGFILFYRWTKA